jgi:signal transduction protein with GAF and PtsI domain
MIVKNPVESILTLAASVFDAYSVVLFEAPSPGHGAPIIAAYSTDDHIDQNAVIQPGKGLAGWILRNRTPLVVGSIDENPAYLGYYKDDWEPDICSFLGCPLPDGGLLCIDSRQRCAFSSEKQKLIMVFADMLAQVQNMDIKNEQDTGTEYLEVLQQISGLQRIYSGWKAYLEQVLPLVLSVSPFSYIALASRSEGSTNYMVEGEFPTVILDEKKTEEISIHNGIIGWVFRNEEAVYNNGQTGFAPIFGKREGVPEFRSTVCIPIMINKNICGVLCLASEEERNISEELKKFLQIVADNLSHLLEVLSLRYRVRAAEKAAHSDEH